jgi:hypothetical protein
MSRVIEYALTGPGWARGAIVLAGCRIELDVSYIHDTFNDIVEALLMASKGQEAVEWVYFHEPRSTHVCLTRAGDRRAIALRRFSDFRVPRPRLGEPGTVIAEGLVLLRKLIADVIIAGSRIIDEHGEQGYLQSWGHHFPTRAFAELKHLRHNKNLL